MLPTLLAAAALTMTGPQVGTPAPDFHLATLAGKSVSLATYKGKTLVLNDWATWCPPCRAETPELAETAKKLTGSGEVVFLGVDSTEQAPIVRAFVAAKGVPYDQAIDADRAFSKAYDVNGFPSTYVIGPDGTLRARVTGEIDGASLAGLVADARAGRNGAIVTAAQKKADALLDPAAFAFTGDAAAIRASAHKALDAIDAAENVDGTTDYNRIVAEANVLRENAIAALTPVAATKEDRVLLGQLTGDLAVAREQWDAAQTAYSSALALSPDDADLIGSLAALAAQRHDYATEIALDEKLVALKPTAGAYEQLAIVQRDAGKNDDARVSFAQAIGRARAAYQADPKKTSAAKTVAGSYLNEAQLFAKSGETAKAHDAYVQTIAWASKLPKSDDRYTIYNERAQEGIVALEMARPAGGATTLSLAPWTGADLPGSIASTYKYRLVVAGKPGKSVDLAASGLPSHWVASFCSDRQCAPFRTTVALPESGVKIIEFQLVPESKLRGPATVRVNGAGASASVTVTE